MRTGVVCAAQQTLTAEAASVLKHSLTLARRRGHAQLTPLHVAATLLSSRSCLFRRACLKAHPPQQQLNQPSSSSHPLHCRALELCFNVALNRLPTNSTPMILHGNQPSLSNALIAALKRAQAHQRRGCIENQQQVQNQQPILTIKVELEQLIISILDDPSVSRVMREAGFSSTCIKNKIEEYSASSSAFSSNSSVPSSPVSSAYSVFHGCGNSSGGVFSTPCSPTRNLNHFLTNYSITEQHPLYFSSPPKPDLSPLKEDVKLVFEILEGKKMMMSRRRQNIVIVSESDSFTEALIRQVIEKVKSGEVPDELKLTKFIEFPSSMKCVKDRGVVETKVLELKRNVASLALRGWGVIIYVGDLKWTVKEEGEEGEEEEVYSPVDHLVSEITRFISDFNNENTLKRRMWIMGSASLQTYIKITQMRQPSLENQWSLQPLSVPSTGLGLSLHSSSNSNVHDPKMIYSQKLSQGVEEAEPFTCKEEVNQLNCCADCTSNYEKEAHQFINSAQPKQLPSWLQPFATDQSHHKDKLIELRREWNKLWQSLHPKTEVHKVSPILGRNQSFNGESFSYNSLPAQKSIYQECSDSISFIEPSRSSNLVPRFRQQQSCTIDFNFENGSQGVEPPCLDSSLKDMEGKEVKLTLSLTSSMPQDSGKPEKHKIQKECLCKKLIERVPWQAEIIPSIAETLIDFELRKQETWILIDGNDLIGKRRLARAISESLFGSSDLVFHFNCGTQSKVKCSYSEQIKRALKIHEKGVVLVEEVDLADMELEKFLAYRFEGRNRVLFRQVVFVLTRDGSKSYHHQCQSVIPMTLKVSNGGLWEVNADQKRKAEWYLPNNAKHTRFDKEEEGKLKKKSSFNSTLDLNLQASAEDEESEEEKHIGEFSPISSDLTGEIGMDPRTQNGFLDGLKNRFVLNGGPARDGVLKEFFESKMRWAFEESYGKQQKKAVSFSVEEKVLEKVLVGLFGYSSSSFGPNSLFDKWLKDILQTSFQSVGKAGKDVIRLRFGGGNEEQINFSGDDGFMGSCLPKDINVCFME